MLSLLLFVSVVAHAAPVLKPHQAYALNSRKEAATAPKSLGNYTSETKVTFESFADEKRTQLLLKSNTEQKILFRSIDPKDGYERGEILFQKFLSDTRMQMPGAVRPFETRQDLSPYLFDRPLVLRSKGEGAGEFENVKVFRESLEQSVKDPVARQGLKFQFGEEALAALAAGNRGAPICAEQIAGRKPKDRWDASRSYGSLALQFRCEFAGWSEAGGKRILVLRFTLPAQKNERRQPNGAMGVTETKGSGSLVLDPASGESLLTLENEVFAEPTAKEIAERGTKNVPRNFSFVRTVTHTYP